MPPKGYQAHLDGGGKMFVCLGRRHEHGRARPLVRRDDPPGQGPRDLLHRREPRGGHLQPGRPRPLRAHPELPRSHAEDEQALLDRQLNRVTDTCIPEEEAMRRIEHSHARGVERRRQAPASASSRTSSSTAAAQRPARAVVPDRPEATAGCSPPARRTCRSSCPAGRTRRSATSSRRTDRRQVKNVSTRALRHRVHDRAGQWYQARRREAGDRLLPDRRRHRRRLPDLRRADAAPGPAAGRRAAWGYFCQISDSTTSYGSYSGAVPNEKITWGKLDVDTPKFLIESDATIVAPLIFAYVLGW